MLRVSLGAVGRKRSRILAASVSAPRFDTRRHFSLVGGGCNALFLSNSSSQQTEEARIRRRSSHLHQLVVVAYKSTALDVDTDEAEVSVVPKPPSRNIETKQNCNAKYIREIRRLTHLRNVGILAHVDAGKTTVTERMLALAGVVREAGTVDDGNTVTDFLPAERERGITIQSAAISFQWGWHNAYTGNDYHPNDNVTVHLIDTPGHVDFSVEVNRSVAVLDGAVLVVDAVAGVQAQTETVWRAMTRPSLNNHDPTTQLIQQQDHAHEPLPCLAFINKMDKEGCHYGSAIQSLRNKLPGANPVHIQIPLFRSTSQARNYSFIMDPTVVAVPPEGNTPGLGDFVGMVDLIHMRAIIYPEVQSKRFAVEDCIPTVVPLMHAILREPIDPTCQVTQVALEERAKLIESLAEIDESMEEYFLSEEEPTNAEIRSALRRATLAKTALPVMAGAALRGRGVEPLLDSIADLLPSPLDRLPPALTKLDDSHWDGGGRGKRRRKKMKKGQDNNSQGASPQTDFAALASEYSIASPASHLPSNITLGHPLHDSLFALAFKVVHMKGRGGGDGRVVFARVYSGEIHDKDVLEVVSPPSPGELPGKPRTERVGGMLELSGGRFHNLDGGKCESGDVCALVGLKTVVTGDTLFLKKSSQNKGAKNRKASADDMGPVCLAGVASPKPVLKVRLEAESSEQQNKLSEKLALMAIEDPSLMVEETESATMLSGLGELHIEVTLDRLYRDYGIEVMVGNPSVAYRETLKDSIETDGMFNFDRMIGATRMQVNIQLRLEPMEICQNEDGSACLVLSEPTVIVEQEAQDFLGMSELEGTDERDEDYGPMDEEDWLQSGHELAQALILGCRGALKRGPLGGYPMANIRCRVMRVDAEGGRAALEAMPGALRAGVAFAIASQLNENKDSCCSLLEPVMSLEVSCPSDAMGTIMTDINGRRGTVGDVIISEDEMQPKALIRGEVPLVEILGYSSNLRSLTGGEGIFTAEYKGHLHCGDSSAVLSSR